MSTEINTATAPSGRIDALGWDDLAGQLNELGCALTEPILSPAECAEIAALYGDDGLFRTTIDMEPRRFGRGQYRYFAGPVPAGALAGPLRRMAGSVPRRRPAAPHAAAAQLRARRLERAAPGPLREAVLPDAGGDRPRRARYRLHGRRIPAGGAAAARPVARDRDGAGPGPGPDLHDQRAAGAV